MEKTLLALGIAMAVGLLFTRLIKLVKLPNVTAYLIGGLLIGPSLWGLITNGGFAILSHEAVESFKIIVNLALGFIAFSIGGEFKISTLRRLGKNVTIITVFQAVGTVLVVFCVLSCAGLLGLLGDIWLDLKYIYPQDSDFWTFSGFFVFMTGHFFYFAAVISHYGIVDPLAAIFAAVSAVGTVIFLLVLEKPTKMHYGKFKAITMTYGAILVSMFAFCLNTALFDGHGNAGILLMTVGGGLFILSDLILSGTYFGEKGVKKVDVITNHTTYYLAQYCIAASALLVNIEF